MPTTENRSTSRPMKKTKAILGTLLALLLLTICVLGALCLGRAEVQVDPPDPPESSGPDVHLPATPSHVPVAVTAPLTALQAQLETALPKQIPVNVDGD